MDGFSVRLFFCWVKIQKTICF